MDSKINATHKKSEATDKEKEDISEPSVDLRSNPDIGNRKVSRKNGALTPTLASTKKTVASQLPIAPLEVVFKKSVIEEIKQDDLKSDPQCSMKDMIASKSDLNNNANNNELIEIEDYEDAIVFNKGPIEKPPETPTALVFNAQNNEKSISEIKEDPNRSSDIHVQEPEITDSAKNESKVSDNQHEIKINEPNKNSTELPEIINENLQNKNIDKPEEKSLEKSELKPDAMPEIIENNINKPQDQISTVREEDISTSKINSKPQSGLVTFRAERKDSQPEDKKLIEKTHKKTESESHDHPPVLRTGTLENETIKEESHEPSPAAPMHKTVERGKTEINNKKDALNEDEDQGFNETFRKIKSGIGRNSRPPQIKPLPSIEQEDLDIHKNTTDNCVKEIEIPLEESPMNEETPKQTVLDCIFIMNY